mgnify:FL=1
MNTNSFSLRHIGPRLHEVKEMLNTIGVNSVNELIDQTIPASIRLNEELDLPEGLS